MLFNSLEFAVYLPVVFLIYWLLANRGVLIRNSFLIIVSYIFYGWWDWRFLSLIIFSSLLDYAVGILLEKENNKTKRKLLLSLSLATNLGLLGFFKYYNFFVDSFVDSFRLFGSQIEGSSLDIVLPVGISFYTFQTLSYTIDVYRKKINATHDIFAFAAFVSFFPQLVAGPIERASNLLPQFSSPKKLSLVNAKDGLRQILWGLFKKIVIADTCAVIVNDIFANYDTYGGGTLALGSVFFAFQIYGDFSGYSDIAIGTAKLFDFKLMKNFSTPYFSRDIAEFWRRWHISLSTWFRDYLYIPLGGSRGSKYRVLGNVIIIFVVSGFWHGANWTFILWGALNAIYYVPFMLIGSNRKNLDHIAEETLFPSLREFFGMIVTFAMACVAWVFFRSENVGQAFVYLKRMATDIMDFSGSANLEFLILLWGFVMWEWHYRKKPHGLFFDHNHQKKVIRWSYYILYIFLIAKFHGEEQQFIYFQF